MAGLCCLVAAWLRVWLGTRKVHSQLQEQGGMRRLHFAFCARAYPRFFCQISGPPNTTPKANGKKHKATSEVCSVCSVAKGGRRPRMPAPNRVLHRDDKSAEGEAGAGAAESSEHVRSYLPLPSNHAPKRDRRALEFQSNYPCWEIDRIESDRLEAANHTARLQSGGGGRSGVQRRCAEYARDEVTKARSARLRFWSAC